MYPRPPEIPPHKLIATLRGYNLLPAIIFMPTRRKCDEAALEVSNDKSQKTDSEKQKQRVAIFDAFAADNPEVKQHKHVRILLNAGVASHHAGHMPPWKLLIEKMMSGGLLNAIFATSTVAAGVDFPARTVVVTNADTRGNDGWRALRASELQQMTGRAGRRGKDNVGFVILTPGQFQNPKKIAELLKAPPDPLESQFRSTYTSLLNLLDAFKSFGQVREIAQKSFAFQKIASRIEAVQAEAEIKLRGLMEQVSENNDDVSLDDVLGFERLISAGARLREIAPLSRAELRREWLEENVVSGRIISQGRSGKRLYIVINVHSDKVSAMREDGQGAAIPLDRVSRIYRNIFPIKESSIERAFFETFEGNNPQIREPRLSKEQNDPDGSAELLSSLVDQVTLKNESRAEFLWSTAKDAAAFEENNKGIEHLYSQIWLPFERRAKVLDHFGYIDFRSEAVTESGKWLADVRVDRTLLVGEALRRGILDDLSPKTLAGLMAALAADSDRNYGDLYLSNELLDVINDFEEIIYEVSNVEWKFGIDPSEEINLSAAGAAERWAGGMAWDDLVKRTNAEEGDLFRLLARTGEALMQIAHLKGSNPAAAAISRMTAETLLREPIK